MYFKINTLNSIFYNILIYGKNTLHKNIFYFINLFGFSTVVQNKINIPIQYTIENDTIVLKHNITIKIQYTVIIFIVNTFVYYMNRAEC